MKYLQLLIESDRAFWPFLILLALILRGPTLFVELYNIDEAFYADSARLWLAGHPPYQGFADMKPLLLFAYYAGVLRLFGDSLRAIHGSTLLWALATAFVLYRAARLLHGENAARLAAFLYTLFPASFMGVDALAANSEILLNLPTALALWAFTRAVSSDRLIFYLLSGGAVSLAALFNFKGGAPLAAFVLACGWTAGRGGQNWKRAIRATMMCLTGFAVPVFCNYLYLYTCGVLQEALYWNFTINRLYIRAGVSLSGFIESLANSLLIFLVFHLLLLVLAWQRCTTLGKIVGRSEEEALSSDVRRPTSDVPQLTVPLVFLVTALAVCLGGRLYGHYLQQLYPSLCLLAAPALDDWLRKYGAGATGLHPRWATAGILVPLLGFALLNNYDYLLRWKPHVVLNEADLKSERVGRHLQALTPPDRTVFVWGFSPSIYYHSHRLPASRFIFVGPLVGETPGGRRWTVAEKRSIDQNRLWRALIADLERAQPLWILDTTVDRSFGPSWGQYSMSHIPPLQAWVPRYYEQVEGIEGFGLWRRK